MIIFDQVTKSFLSGHTALDNVSFEIDSGEFVFLMGPSGSGKTTLLRLILREFAPTSGKITVANHDLDKLSKKQIPLLRRQIGSAFQDFKLIPDKSAFENVALALEILGKASREINHVTSLLLERVGLGDKMHLYPAQLSGGEIQRVTIARAVATDPVLLFADEPTGNLDPQTSKEIIDLLKEIHSNGTTVIMSTHDVNLANSFNYRQIVLDKGKLASDKPAKNKTKTEDKEPKNADHQGKNDLLKKSKKDHKDEKIQSEKKGEEE